MKQLPLPGMEQDLEVQQKVLGAFKKLDKISIFDRPLRGYNMYERLDTGPTHLPTLDLHGVTLLPFTFEVRALREVPVQSYADEKAYNNRIELQVRVNNVENGHPLLVNFNHYLDGYLCENWESMIRTVLKASFEHELDECLRNSSGEHFRDPHAAERVTVKGYMRDNNSR